MKKYLQRNPVTPWQIEPPPTVLYSHAVVIPVLAEKEYLPHTLESLAKNPPELLKNILILVVVNNPPEAPTDDFTENQEILESLKKGDIGKGLKLVWIDASSPGRELIKGGVGAARKLGLDAVLPHLAPGALLFSLDADTLVGPDYFSLAVEFFAGNPDCAGAIFNFSHQPGDTPESDRAIKIYEQYLRDYADGLEFAGSPYAYVVIGSAMVCPVEIYVRAGGMRVRTGGEDFYFLQALRKIGPIGKITSTVHPSARTSQRVPFGTGPKVREVMETGSIRQYHRESFELLREIMKVAENSTPEDFGNIFTSPDQSEPIKNYFTSTGFAAVWKKILANTPVTDQARRQAFHTWFDAFRTLKFVHFCEEGKQ